MVVGRVEKTDETCEIIQSDMSKQKKMANSV